jgi:UPF0716 protein FxsA
MIGYLSSGHGPRGKLNPLDPYFGPFEEFSMFGRLLFLFLIMPFLELFTLIKVHQFLGQNWGSQNAWMFTLGMIFIAAVAGVSLAKSQGFRLLAQAQDQLRQGTLPSQTMLEGLLMLAGAAAFIVPGYITDVLGLFLLIPWTRSLFVKALKSWLGRQVQSGTIVMHQAGFYSQPGTLIQESDGVEIIDVQPLQKSTDV